MPSAADVATLTAAITQAQGLALTPLQMVALLDQAIGVAVAKGDIVVSYNMAGQQVQRSLDQARALRQYYQNEYERLLARATPLVALDTELVG